MSEARTIDTNRCPVCGQANRCAMEIERATGRKQGPCWCVQMSFHADVLAKVPADLAGRACICEACARAGK